MTTEDYYDEKSTTYDAIFNMLYYRIYDTITWKYIEPYLPKAPAQSFLTLQEAQDDGQYAWHKQAAKSF